MTQQGLKNVWNVLPVGKSPLVLLCIESTNQSDTCLKVTLVLVSEGINKIFSIFVGGILAKLIYFSPVFFTAELF